MLAWKRREMIEDLLQLQESLSMQELIDYLHVSAATIRRDIILMEKEGQLVRIHGGVHKKECGSRISEVDELPAKRKIDLRAAEKLKIARAASACVQEGDCIFIDSGSTPSYIYDFIRHKKIMVVTNNLLLIKKIKPMDHARVILGAGEYNALHHLVDGPLFLEIISQFNFHHAFIGVSGIDYNTHCLTCTSLTASSIKKHAMLHSLHSYILADSSKHREKGIVTFAKAEEFDAIYTTESEGEHNIENLTIVE